MAHKQVNVRYICWVSCKEINSFYLDFVYLSFSKWLFVQTSRMHWFAWEPIYMFIKVVRFFQTQL